MTFLLRLFFTCHHKRTTWPQTHNGQCHVACLACGASLRYSWAEMRVMR